MNDKEIALSTYERFTGKTEKHLTSELNIIAPDVNNYIMDFVFGEIYSRQGLNDQEKTIVTMISLLSIGGCEHELNTHINAALNINIPPKKIIDLFIQALPYAGFPRVVNAINIAKIVFEDRNIQFKI